MPDVNPTTLQFPGLALDLFQGVEKISQSATFSFKKNLPGSWYFNIFLILSFILLSLCLPSPINGR